MNQANLFLIKAFTVVLVLPAEAWRRATSNLPAGRDSDRGDIPGWVMIAIMSAAVVVVLIPFVGPVIAKAFNNAVDGVTNTKSGSTGQ